MESESNVNKPHYNIAMSKRTRKPQLRYIQDAAFTPTEKEETDSTNNDEEVKVKNSDQRIDGSDCNKKSLKQLIKMSGVVRGNTLGQHFLEEERQLQLAITKRQQEEASCDGTKFKGMMGHYVKLLSHLIKIKPGPHLKNKTLRRLTM